MNIIAPQYILLGCFFLLLTERGDYVGGFNDFHPAVCFTYFVIVTVFSMVFMHPVCLAISVAFAFMFSLMLKGHKSAVFALRFLLPMAIITALISPAFNHRGVTVLCYFPSGNPLTLESVLYGLAAAGMVSAVILWFSCINEVMTSDKLTYLFGRFIPSLSLVFSMCLRFVPHFKAQFIEVSNSQKCLGQNPSSGGIIIRAKRGLVIMSIMVTRSLENAVDTADSMKSRGYGLPHRTAFSLYRFEKRDSVALLCIVILGLYISLSAFFGGLNFRYFPSVKSDSYGIYGASVFVAYLLLFALPIIIGLWERRRKKWKS